MQCGRQCVYNAADADDPVIYILSVTMSCHQEFREFQQRYTVLYER